MFDGARYAEGWVLKYERNVLLQAASDGCFGRGRTRLGKLLAGDAGKVDLKTVGWPVVE